MPKRSDRARTQTGEPTTSRLVDVERGRRVRIEAIVLGKGGLIGTRVQVDDWTGPLASTMPVEVLPATP